jgi:hypothetical protein
MSSTGGGARPSLGHLRDGDALALALLVNLGEDLVAVQVLEGVVLHVHLDPGARLHHVGVARVRASLRARGLDEQRTVVSVVQVHRFRREPDGAKRAHDGAHDGARRRADDSADEARLLGLHGHVVGGLACARAHGGAPRRLGVVAARAGRTHLV